jgi:Arm DNA-binding domain
MKLTQKVVDTLVLPPGKAESFAWDDDVPGLAVRIQGKRTTWVVQSRVAGGRQQRVTLGPVAGISLKAARGKAGRILADAKDGKSASAERHLTRQRTETRWASSATST